MRILYIQYTNPAGYPPLQHSSRILANNGWEVLFLGTGAQGADALKFPSHPKIRVKQLRFCPGGLRQKLHYTMFGLWTLLWALLWRPRWIYASDPLSCPIAALLSFAPGLRVLYHEHDSPDTSVSTRAFERSILFLRRVVGRRADLCILPNEERARAFRNQTGADRSVVCIWNCPSRDEAAALNEGKPDDSFVIFFHGSIVPSRLPLSVIEALARLPERVVLHVAGYETIGHAGYVQALMEHAQSLGVDSRVKYLGAFSRHSLLDYCRRAYVGLSFMPLQSHDVNERAMTGASNKPFDYLACGLALLVSDLPEWRKMFVESGFGLACDPQDARSIAEAVEWFLKNPVQVRSMGSLGRRQILTEWNYERQFAPVLTRMASA